MPTSKLQRKTSMMIYDHLGQYRVYENSRPDWLITDGGQRLELDFYFPELNIAIEVQGKQHYVFSSFFHKNEDDFRAQLWRDRIKKQLCDKHGTELFEVSDYEEAREIIFSIAQKPMKMTIHRNVIIAISAMYNSESPKEERGKPLSKKPTKVYARHLAEQGYSSTTKRHLKRLFNMLSKPITESTYQGIQNSLGALVQYESIKGKMALHSIEEDLLKRAKETLRIWDD